MSDHTKRLEALERKLNVKHPSLRILQIEGCLPGPIAMASAGAHRWRREPGEELEQFVERCAGLCVAAGETSLIVGGLPESLEELGYSDFESWWAAEVAPTYSDVPPVEEPGSRWSAPRSRLGYVD
jgi:hypothetical protein